MRSSYYDFNPTHQFFFNFVDIFVELDSRRMKMSSAQISMQRNAFTDIERQRLRRQRQKYPSTTPQALASWFELEFSRKISASSVHDILSDKYARLDNTEATDATRKQRGPQWPDLEDGLSKWWQEVQPRHVDGKELKDKAKELWQKIPSCQGKKAPSFSKGWLTKLRNRHGLVQPKETAGITCEAPGPDSMGLHMAWDLMPFDLSPVLRNAPFHDGSIQYTHCAVNLLRKPTLSAMPRSFTSNHVQMTDDGRKHRINSPYFKQTPQSGGKWHRSTNSNVNHKHHAKRRCTKGSRSQHITLEIDSTGDRVASAHTCTQTEVVLDHDINQNSLSIDPNFWNNIWVLSSNCSDQMARDIFMPAEKVLRVFEPILRAAEENFKQKIPEILGDTQRREVAASDFSKVIEVLNAAALFKLSRSSDERQATFIEDWFLDFIRPEMVRSQSPETLAEDERNSIIHTRNGAWALDSFRRQRPQSHAVITSTVGRGGRIDIYTRTYTNTQNNNETDTAEQYYANITVTPPWHVVGVQHIPQTLCRLARETTIHTSTLLTPIISFRRIRPDDDYIFTIARSGTSEALQMAFSNGEASLHDCNPQGRSLISVSLL
jgi:hypothetical protein